MPGNKSLCAMLGPFLAFPEAFLCLTFNLLYGKLFEAESTFALVSHPGPQGSTSPCVTVRGHAWREQDFSSPPFMVCGSPYPALSMGAAQQADENLELHWKRLPFCLRDMVFPQNSALKGVCFSSTFEILMFYNEMWFPGGQHDCGSTFHPVVPWCNVEGASCFYYSALHNSSAKESSAQPNAIENIFLGKQKYPPGFVHIYSRQMKCIN